MHEPPLLVLHEPTSGLNPLVQAAVLDRPPANDAFAGLGGVRVLGVHEGRPPHGARPSVAGLRGYCRASLRSRSPTSPYPLTDLESALLRYYRDAALSTHEEDVQAGLQHHWQDWNAATR